LSLLAVLRKSHLPPRLNRHGLRHNPPPPPPPPLVPILRVCGRKNSSRPCKTSRTRVSIFTLLSTTFGLMLVQFSTRNFAFLNENGSVRSQIEGHTDERGTAQYNLVLGERRANAAKQYLTTAGINPARLSTISYGEERPLDPGHDEAAWARNRRDHFVLTG